MIFESILIIGFAIILDLIIGDPRNKYHPTAWIGNLISNLVPLFKNENSQLEKFGGILIVIILTVVIGGLLIILCLPMFATLVGSELIAIEEAKEFGNEVGATILAASTAFQMCGFLMIIGIFLLGASLTLQRKYKGIVGALFMITTILSFIDIVSAGAAGEVVSIIGWMGFFLMTLITGILTLVPSLKK